MLSPRNLRLRMTIALVVICCSSSVQAGFLRFKLTLDLDDDKSSPIETLSASTADQPLPKPVPVKHYLHPEVNVSKAGGLSSPYNQLPDGGTTLGTTNSQGFAEIPQPQLITKLVLASNRALPPPLSHRLFHPPRNTEFMIDQVKYRDFVFLHF